MASGDTKFSHITVNADDDDDFVIQAGVRPSVHASESVQAYGATPSEPSFAVGLSTEDEREAPATDDVRSSSADSKKGYRETTAEDLEVEPMPAMQKIIIAVALLAIVGFIAYYVLFMR